RTARERRTAPLAAASALRPGAAAPYRFAPDRRPEWGAAPARQGGPWAAEAWARRRVRRQQAVSEPRPRVRASPARRLGAGRGPPGRDRRFQPRGERLSLLGRLPRAPARRARERVLGAVELVQAEARFGEPQVRKVARLEVGAVGEDVPARLRTQRNRAL